MAIPTTTTTPAAPVKDDPGFMHFLRFVGIWILMGALSVIFIGLIWAVIALSQTGRRKRDILMYLIPIWGVVVQVQTIWRYTAKNVYWSPRADRPSKSLFSA
jgi:ABC-type sugar transport system permease subunit